MTMPTRAEIKKLVMAAEEAGDEEAVADLMGMYNEAPEDAAPAAPVPAAAAAPAGPEPLEDSPLSSWIQKNAPAWSPNTAMATGIARYGEGMVRGIRQRYNEIRGDKETAARLKASEAKARALREDTSKSMYPGFEKAGYYGAGLGSFAIPGTGIAKLPALANVGRAAQIAATVGTEAAIGGAQGAARPTVEGESAADNAKWSAIAGGALPASGIIARRVGDAAEFLPFIGGRVTGRRMRLASEARGAEESARKHAADVRRVETENAKVVRQQVNNARQAAKEQFPVRQRDLLQRIGTTFSTATKGERIPVPKHRVDALRSIERRFGDAMPAEYKKLVNDMEGISNYGQGKAEILQQAKSALGEAARNAKKKGEPSTGFDAAERVMRETLLEGLPKQKSEALRVAYERFAKVVNAKPKLPQVPAGRIRPIPAAPTNELPAELPWLQDPQTRALLRSYLLSDEYTE